VAHLSDGRLRLIVDEPDSIAGADARHYADCAECKARGAALADDAKAIAGLLAVPAMKVDVQSAYKRMTAAPVRPKFGLRLPIFRPSGRPLFVAVAVAAILVSVVSAVAAVNLNSFTPTQLQPVPVSMADVQALSALGDYGTITWTKQPAPQLVTSAADAANISGLNVPAVSQLPSTVSKNITYGAMPNAVGTFTFSADKAAAAAAKTGKALPPLPKGMDGATLTISVGPAVVEVFGNLQSTGGATDVSHLTLPDLVVVKSTAPVITSTQVSAKDIESYVASVPGVSPALASTLKSISDPNTTLLIPVPVDYGSSKPQDVQGVTGLALGDNSGLGSAVIWVKGGSVYAVAGSLKLDQIVAIANQVS
jgi:hypothetical protein